MAKVSPAKLVERIYQQGRSYYDGKRYVGYEGEVTKAGNITVGQWELDAKNNSPEPQAQSDKRAPGYDNNTKEGWLIGKGPVHPHFDATPRGKKPY